MTSPGRRAGYGPFSAELVLDETYTVRSSIRRGINRKVEKNYIYNRIKNKFICRKNDLFSAGT